MATLLVFFLKKLITRCSQVKILGFKIGKVRIGLRQDAIGNFIKVATLQDFFAGRITELGVLPNVIGPLGFLETNLRAIVFLGGMIFGNNPSPKAKFMIGGEDKKTSGRGEKLTVRRDALSGQNARRGFRESQLRLASKASFAQFAVLATLVPQSLVASFRSIGCHACALWRRLGRSVRA